MNCKRFSLHAIGLFLVLLLLTACESEPVQKVYYIQTPQVLQKLGDSIMGHYEGRLMVVMLDTAKHQRVDEEGLWERKARRDSILNFPYMVGGYSRPFITIPDFPVSWVANAVCDPELKEALRMQPNTGITLGYQIRHDFGDDIKSKKGRVILGTSPVTFYINYGGSRRLVNLYFSNNSESYEIDAGDESTWRINHIRLSLRNINIDGKRVGELDDFDNPALFEVFIDGVKKER